MAYEVPASPAAYNVEMSFDVRDAEGNTHNFKSEVEIGLDDDFGCEYRKHLKVWTVIKALNLLI